MGSGLHCRCNIVLTVSKLSLMHSMAVKLSEHSSQEAKHYWRGRQRLKIVWHPYHHILRMALMRGALFST